MFFKIGVLKNFPIFTGKQLCWSLFLIKLQDRRPATLLKKIFQHRFLPVNIAKFSRTPFFIEQHISWLLLPYVTSVIIGYVLLNIYFSDLQLPFQNPDFLYSGHCYPVFLGQGSRFLKWPCCLYILYTFYVINMPRPKPMYLNN